MLEQPHFKHKDGNSTFIAPEDWPQVDAVVDWLIEKNRSGYKMANSVRRLQEMKVFMRGKLQDWDCRAGQNSLNQELTAVEIRLTGDTPIVRGIIHGGSKAPGCHRSE